MNGKDCNKNLDGVFSIEPEMDRVSKYIPYCKKLNCGLSNKLYKECKQDCSEIVKLRDIVLWEKRRWKITPQHTISFKKLEII